MSDIKPIPQPAEVWTHIKSGKKYQIVGHCMVKQDGEWHPGVSYVNGHSPLYVRTVTDFVNKFRKAP